MQMKRSEALRSAEEIPKKIRREKRGKMKEKQKRDSKKIVSTVLTAILVISAFAAAFVPSTSAVNEDVTVTIDDCNAPVSGNVTTPIMINNVTDAGTATINLIYNASVVHVDSVSGGDFDFRDATIDNANGITTIGVMQMFNPGLNGNVTVCDVTLTAVGNEAETSALGLVVIELKDATPPLEEIPRTVINGTFTIQDETPPVVTDPSADPIIISNAAVIYGATESLLSVTVTDQSDISSVTIDLSSIGGSATEPMTNVPGTDIYTTTTTASIAGVHLLQVNATDEWGNSNTAVNITLTVVEPAVVTIEDNINVELSGTVNASIMINGVSSDAAAAVANIILTYNASVVHVTAIGDSDFDFVDANIDNVAGFATIGGMQLTNPSLSGDVQLCDVTFESIGSVEAAESTLNLSILELVTEGPPAVEIPANVDNGSIIIIDETAPVVTDPSADPVIISNAAVIYGAIESQLNVTVTDASPISSVTIDLSSIGGSAAEPMLNVPGTDVYTTTTTASIAGVHLLQVNATDESDNSNTSVNISLTVVEPAVVTIEDEINVPPGGTVNASIMINGVSSDAAAAVANIILTYNASVVHVTAIGGGDFDYVDSNIDNVTGVATIDGTQLTNPSLSGDVQLCNVTFEGVGPVEAESTLNLSISELVTEGPPAVEIPANVDNGSIKVGELNPPVVVNPVANPDSIPDDTDNGDPAYIQWLEISELAVEVTDDSGVASVTIDLSQIGGSATEPMVNIMGDIWTVETNASSGMTSPFVAGDYVPFALYVNATDIYGNSNTSVAIPLVVVKNGDVNEDSAKMLSDAMYLAKNVLNKPGYGVIHVGASDVTGDGAKMLSDAMYLAKNVLNKPGYSPLH